MLTDGIKEMLGLQETMHNCCNLCLYSMKQQHKRMVFCVCVFLRGVVNIIFILRKWKYMHTSTMLEDDAMFINNKTGSRIYLDNYYAMKSTKYFHCVIVSRRLVTDYQTHMPFDLMARFQATPPGNHQTHCSW